MGDDAGRPPLVVTVSATYGAGGSVIAPRLAERLGVHWLDRLVSAGVASDTATPATPATPATSATPSPAGTGYASEALSDAEAASTPGSRLFTYLARAVGVGGLVPPDGVVDHEEELRASAEREIVELCAAGGVLLGRAGAVVLADRRSTFHVRLDGPAEARAERAAAIEAISPAQARVRLRDTDRARTLYVRRLYRADPTDPSLYHLVLDTTVVAPADAVEIVATAVEGYRSAQGTGSGGW